MPELPDLQVFAKNLTLQLNGKKLERIQVHEAKQLDVDEKTLNRTLKTKSLSNVYRLGKQLYFDFGRDAILSMHLMLHGKLVIGNGKTPKHAIVSMDFQSGITLTLTDFQKAANIHLNPERPKSVDALSADVTASWLSEQLQNSRAAIKNVLMDQHIISGIGNAYADEILWHARIAPQSIASKIPQKQLTKLAGSIKETLTDAEKQIQKAKPDIISGEFRDFLAVHGSKKGKSPTGRTILKTRVGGRTTYYTEEQQLYR